MSTPDELLAQALKILIAANVDVAEYEFSPVDGATQATVWRGASPRGTSSAVALRLTPKPMGLIKRIASLVDAVNDVTCPRTLAVEQLSDGDRLWTVHLCTWIGTGAPQRPDMRLLGQSLARLHLAMGESSIDVTDRQLTFARNPAPSPDQELPAWYVARNVWRDRIFAWLSVQTQQAVAQPIHGDMHWGNIVATPTGFGFIDFDKLMFAPVVFDLAKLISTGLFTVGERARFQARRTTDLLEGYESLRPLSPVDLVALEGLAVLLNEETARLGSLYDDDAYRSNAAAVADWWINRRRRAPNDPLGIRSSRQTPSPDRANSEQVPLWPDENSDTDEQR